MRTYGEIAMIVNGNKTDCIEIFREHNTFAVFRNSENVFMGKYGELMNFITEWQNKNTDIVNFLNTHGMNVEYVRKGI